jgi:hypothetical protein
MATHYNSGSTGMGTGAERGDIVAKRRLYTNAEL